MSLNGTRMAPTSQGKVKLRNSEELTPEEITLRQKRKRRQELKQLKRENPEAYREVMERQRRKKEREEQRAQTAPQTAAPLEVRLARAYLAELAGVPVETAEQLPLRYYRDQLYKRRDGHWEAAEEREVEAHLTAFLGRQDLPRLNGLPAGVLRAIRGETLLTGRLALPLWIGDDGQVQQRNLLAVENGLLDLDAEEPELLPHSTRWLSECVLPFPYDSEAECPRWLKFLGEALKPRGDGDRRIRVIQEFFGYSLLADSRYQKMLLLHGKAASGKSIILSVLTALLGEDNVAHATLEQLSGPFGLQGLLGKLACICADLSETSKHDEGILKQLTGGDRLNVQRKFKTPVSLPPVVKFAFSANVMPRFHDASDGLWRRLLTVPFLRSVPPENRDPNLLAKLTDPEEMAGILRWSLAGMARLQRRGRFTNCQECDRAREQHRLDCSSTLTFLREHRGWILKGERPTRQKVYDCYSKWCKRSGYRTPGLAEFVRRAEEDGLVPCAYHGRKCFKAT